MTTLDNSVLTSITGGTTKQKLQLDLLRTSLADAARAQQQSTTQLAQVAMLAMLARR